MRLWDCRATTQNTTAHTHTCAPLGLRIDNLVDELNALEAAALRLADLFRADSLRVICRDGVGFRDAAQLHCGQEESSEDCRANLARQSRQSPAPWLRLRRQGQVGGEMGGEMDGRRVSGCWVGGRVW